MLESARSRTAVLKRAGSGQGGEVGLKAPRGCSCQAGAGLATLLKPALLWSRTVSLVFAWCASMPGPPACAASVLVGGLRDVGMPTAGMAARKLPVLRSHSASCPGALSACQMSQIRLKRLISDDVVSFSLLKTLAEQTSAGGTCKCEIYRCAEACRCILSISVSYSQWCQVI